MKVIKVKKNQMYRWYNQWELDKRAIAIDAFTRHFKKIDSGFANV